MSSVKICATVAKNIFPELLLRLSEQRVFLEQEMTMLVGFVRGSTFILSINQ